MRISRLLSIATALVLLTTGQAVAGVVVGEEQVVTVRDVVYRSVDGQDLKLDIYRPAITGDLPAVILIHEGAWRWGSKEAWEQSAPELAREGFVAVAINHRLAPDGGVWHAPAQIRDVRAAVAWVRENGGSFGIDTSRIGALGPSSGGHLAMLAATTSRRPEQDLQAVVSWSGPTFLTRDLGEPGIRSLVRNYIGCGRLTCPEKWRAESPGLQVDADAPPMLLANGASEAISINQAIWMANRLRANRVPARVVAPDTDAHGMALLPWVWDTSIDFLRRRLAAA